MTLTFDLLLVQLCGVLYTGTSPPINFYTSWVFPSVYGLRRMSCVDLRVLCLEHGVSARICEVLVSRGMCDLPIKMLGLLELFIVEKLKK